MLNYIVSDQQNHQFSVPEIQFPEDGSPRITKNIYIVHLQQKWLRNCSSNISVIPALPHLHSVSLNTQLLSLNGLFLSIIFQVKHRLKKQKTIKYFVFHCSQFYHYSDTNPVHWFKNPPIIPKVHIVPPGHCSPVPLPSAYLLFPVNATNGQWWRWQVCDWMRSDRFIYSSVAPAQARPLVATGIAAGKASCSQ